MVPNITLLCWKRLTYAFRIKILGTSVFLNVGAKSYKCPSARRSSAGNAIGSGFDTFIGSTVSINDFLVFVTCRR